MTKLDEIAAAMQTYSVYRLDKGAVECGSYSIWSRDGKAPIKSGLDQMSAHSECARLNARAAIEAMREPTTDMIEAGSRAEYLRSRQVIGVWRAMIDAMLAVPAEKEDAP
jgi:hypothetical protein